MLENKVAFITGSTRGIGWSTARFFAAQGATVLLNGVSNKVLLMIVSIRLRMIWCDL